MKPTNSFPPTSPESCFVKKPSPLKFSLRDRFAVAALQGVLASGSMNIDSYEGAAKEAYRFANAMLKAREE